MKRTLAMLLTVCLMIGIAAPAYADDTTVQDEAPVVVSNLAELQAAVDAAEDGAIIAVSDTIHINSSTVSTTKSITICRDDSFSQSQSPLLRLNDNATLQGFTVADNSKGICTVEILGNNTEIIDCLFQGQGESDNYFNGFLIARYEASCHMEDCSFVACNGCAITIEDNVNVTMDRCILEANIMGSISNSGITTLYHCTISNGECIENHGILTLNDCVLEKNSPWDELGQDIYCSRGQLYIQNQEVERDYFNYDTGEQLTLPFQTSEEIKIYSRSPVESITDDRTENPSDLSNDSEKNNTENPAPTEEETDLKPAPSEQQPEPAEQPEQPQDEREPPTPQQPQEPTDKDDRARTGNDTPPAYKPVNIGTKPVEPVAEPQKPTLACGDAVIDTSRSVVLQGWDGLIHEDDPLTRAQLAAIIYRLLDDDTISRYSEGNSSFTDVPPDAWFAPFVYVIECAGIVNGVGAGKYAPDGLVSWAQVITLISRFVSPKKYELQNIQYHGWAQEAIQAAVAYGWIEDSADFDPNAIVSRGELVRLVNGVLEQYR